MSPIFKRVLLVLAVVGMAASAPALSLLGPFAAYQTSEIGYDPLNNGADIGGPMNLGEEYRWNTRVITYGFDESFLNYFGAQGKAAVEQAIAILNQLPSTSQMSSNLAEFPLNTKRVNYQASALGMLDLKSTALGLLVEELGLAQPERFIWTLRNRDTSNNRTNYLVVRRNFDPVAGTPSPYVNGTLYTYHIAILPLTGGGVYFDAVEDPVDPLAFTYTAVASQRLGYGEFFTGLTRDDVGALRYLYGANNYNTETLIPGTTGQGTGDCPWCVPGDTNATGTNVIFLVDQALRPGIGKITFQECPNDSVFGGFVVMTNKTTDTYVTNSSLATQNIQRVINQPDILFAAGDNGLTGSGYPIAVVRTDTAGWANNDAINGGPGAAGPGVVQPQVVITFNNIGPFLINAAPSSLDEASGGSGFVWGSFDGSTNPPVVFPSGTSIQDLEQQVLGGP